MVGEHWRARGGVEGGGVQAHLGLATCDRWRLPQLQLLLLLLLQLLLLLGDEAALGLQLHQAGGS